MSEITTVTDAELVERARAVVSIHGDDVLVVEPGRMDQSDPDIEVVDLEPNGGAWVKAFIWVSLSHDEVAEECGTSIEVREGGS